MSDPRPELDLKFLPDWLKEPAGKNPYADFEGEVSNRSSRHDFDRGQGDSRGRPGGPSRGGPRSGGPGGGPRGGQNRGPRRPQDRPQDRPPGQPQGSPALESISIPKRPPGAPPRPPLARSTQPGQSHPQGDRSGRDPREFRESRDSRQGRNWSDSAAGRPENVSRSPDRVVVPLHVEIVPETAGTVALAKQIKTSHRAYPLYGLGRMFLNKPERHRVRITSNAPACPLYQVGENGPVSLNRQAAEREAFQTCQAKYYTEETIQLDPPKGNFSNVARCRFSGVLLGPTNHHGYQPALRRLYDSRFSRRMDFNDFLRQIEVVNDPAVVDQWKAQASSVTIFRTTQEAEPLEFKTVQEVEAHFRTAYLTKEVRSGRTLEMSGLASRDVGDRDIRDAVREAWEKERAFPAQIVNQIRPHFTDAGLHIWKHRKRILFVSLCRPVRFSTDARNVSEHIANILNVVETTPKCTRAEISNRLLKPHESEEGFQKLKGALVSDLHWLIQSGHVIEFHDGILDLPLLPKDLAKEAQERGSLQNEGDTQEPSAEERAEAPTETPCAEAAAATRCAEAVEATPCAEAVVESPGAEIVAEKPCEEVAGEIPCAPSLEPLQSEGVPPDERPDVSVELASESGFSPADEPENSQEKDCTDNRTEEPGGLAGLVPADQTAEQGGDQASGDTQQCSGDAPHGSMLRNDEFRDESHDESKDDGPQPEHTR